MIVNPLELYSNTCFVVLFKFTFWNGIRKNIFLSLKLVYSWLVVTMKLFWWEFSLRKFILFHFNKCPLLLLLSRQIEHVLTCEKLFKDQILLYNVLKLLSFISNENFEALSYLLITTVGSLQIQSQSVHGKEVESNVGCISDEDHQAVGGIASSPPPPSSSLPQVTLASVWLPSSSSTSHLMN